MSVIDQAQAKLDRMRELEPAVQEYRQLEKEVEAFASTAARARTKGKRRVSRPTASGSKGRSPKRGRPRGSGKRAMQAAGLVGQNPGITIPHLAAKMGIQPNYLYRVLPQLESEGKVKKGSGTDKGWYPA
jgi:ribosomal protein S25